MAAVAEAAAPVEPRLYTVAEAARRLSLSKWSIYQMVSAGTLPCVRTGPRGRTLRIAEADLARAASPGDSKATPRAR
jgi:excisionase family DNA binding protein